MPTGSGLRLLGRLARQRRRRLVAVFLVGACLYQLLLLAPFVAYGTLPNYFRLRGAWGGIVESIRLRPPLGALWGLVADQPVFEFGVVDRLGFIALQFVATTHSLITMLLLPGLMAALVLLLTEARAVLRRSSGTVAQAVGLGLPTIASLFGASTSAAACCGVSSGPLLLTILGVGFGTASVIVDHAEALEVAGYALLVANIVVLSSWLDRRAAGGSSGVAIPGDGRLSGCSIDSIRPPAAPAQEEAL